MLSVRELWESTNRKHNGDAGRKGREAAIDEFSKRYAKLLEEKKIGWGDVSIRQLWESLVVSQDLEEDINSSAFPATMELTVQTRVMQAYNSIPKVWQQLVTVIPANAKEVTAQGFGPISDLYEVKEGDEYRELSFGEKSVSIPTKKHGGIFSITEETIRFDSTGQILQKAQSLGERGAIFQNKLVLKAVVDANANVYDGGELYKSDNSHANYISGADSALGTSGWEAIDLALSQQVDEDSEPIDVAAIGRPILMVPPRLKVAALKLKNGEYGSIGTANLDPNIAKDQFDVMVNPYIPSYTTTPVWFYGDFKRQFAYLEVMPIETKSRAGQDTEEGFHRDVIQMFKVRMMAGIGAVDTRYVIKSAGV